MVRNARYFTATDIMCGHRGCKSPATESEAFRLKTPPGSRYKTKLTWFHRCERHEHSHLRKIGYSPRRLALTHARKRSRK
jgi:hypothetical protein